MHTAALLLLLLQLLTTCWQSYALPINRGDKADSADRIQNDEESQLQIQEATPVWPPLDSAGDEWLATYEPYTTLPELESGTKWSEGEEPPVPEMIRMLTALGVTVLAASLFGTFCYVLFRLIGSKITEMTERGPYDLPYPPNLLIAPNLLNLLNPPNPSDLPNLPHPPNLPEAPADQPPKMESQQPKMHTPPSSSIALSGPPLVSAEVHPDPDVRRNISGSPRANRGPEVAMEYVHQDPLFAIQEAH